MAASRKVLKNVIKIGITDRQLFKLIQLSEKTTLDAVEIERVCLGILKSIVSADSNVAVQSFLIDKYLDTVSKCATYPDIIKYISAAASKKLPTSVMENLYVKALELAMQHHAFDLNIRRMQLYYDYLLSSQAKDVPLDIHFRFASYYFSTNQIEKTLPHLRILSESKDISAQIIGHVNLGQSYQALDNYSAAVEEFIKVIKIYDANLKETHIAKKHSEHVSNAAHNCAKLLDNSPGNMTADPDLALYYYRIGAKLNNPFSLHDLGYKYDTGEDVLRNPRTALAFYRKADALGNPASLLNIFILLNDMQLDCSAELTRLIELDNEVNIRVQLFNYYIVQYQKKLKEDSHDSAASQEFGRRAFHYAKSVVNDKDFGLHNLAICYHFGIGVDCNEHLAEKYYLTSIEKGYIYSRQCLERVYSDRVLGTKSKANFVEIPRSEMHKQEVIDDVHLTRLKDSLAVIGEVVEHSIHSLKDNADIAVQQKITALLKYHVSSLNAGSIVSVVHQLGCLTESSLDQRRFHNTQLPAIFPVLDDVEKRLALQEFTYAQIKNLIEGISKLYLQKNVNQLESLFLNLYLEALRLDDTTDAYAQVKIIYAATRLEPGHAVFNEVLPQLIAKVSIENLDHYSFAKYYYAMAILDNLSPAILSNNKIKKLVKQSLAMRERHYRRDEVILRQHSVATYYFYVTKSDLFRQYLMDAKQELQNNVSEFEDITTCSKLQEQVVGFVAQYFPDYEVEARIDSFPVDAHVDVDQDKSFILQVDGPTHYLHALDSDPVYTPKTLLRNIILGFSKPVVCVAYFKWDKSAKDVDKADYLKSLLTQINIPMNEKWSRSKQSGISFWKKPRDLGKGAPATPRSARSP